MAQRKFRFGIQTARARTGEDWAAKARKIEDLGFSTLFMPDHFGDQFAPTPALMAAADATKTLRIGGLVQNGSVKRDTGLDIEFVVTDGKNAVPVNYSGVLPDLFREGQGVVALGTRGSDGVFQAREVLAKHDETYMPPEVVDALKRAGKWKEGVGPL